MAYLSQLIHMVLIVLDCWSSKHNLVKQKLRQSVSLLFISKVNSLEDTVEEWHLETLNSKPSSLQGKT